MTLPWRVAQLADGRWCVLCGQRSGPGDERDLDDAQLAARLFWIAVDGAVDAADAVRTFLFVRDGKAPAFMFMDITHEMYARGRTIARVLSIDDAVEPPSWIRAAVHAELQARRVAR